MPGLSSCFSRLTPIKATRRLQGILRKSTARVQNEDSAAAVGFAILIPALAHGQAFIRGWDTPTPLTDTDRAIIRSTVERQIHGKPVGTSVTWRNPAGGHAGTITLLGKSTRQGTPCERIQYQLMEPGSAQQQHGSYVLTSCRLPDGSWKLAG